MSQAPSVAFAGSTGDSHTEAVGEAPAGAPGDVPANVSLRGTTRGLEILVSGTPTAAALGARLTELLAEAPGFFSGSNARVAIDGALPLGALACLEQVAAQFELRLVEIGPVAARRLRGELTAVSGATPTLPPIPPIPPIPPPAAAPAPVAAVVVDATGDEVLRPGLAEGTGRVREDRAGALAPAAGAAAAATPDTDGAAPKAATAATVDSVGTAALGPVATHSAAAAIAALTQAAAIAGEAAGGPASATAGEAAGKAAVATGDAPRKAAPVAGAASELELVAALAAVLVQAGASERVAAEAAVAAAAAPEPDEPPGPRLVIGPVRSGRIVDHVGHLIVVGDVNPGAEVRAEGSIIVLGRLRGVAHAAIGRNAGCIIALSLAPQQLRIGRMVARAGDADRPSGGAEIAYATGETIVVERFTGRLPSGLAASM
jgi:septum formation inhibitor MinC